MATANRDSINLSDGAALALVAGLGLAAYLAAKKAGGLITTAATAANDAAHEIAAAPGRIIEDTITAPYDAYQYARDARSGPPSARPVSPTTTRAEILNGNAAWTPQTGDHGPHLKYIPEVPLVPYGIVTRPLVDFFNARLDEKYERDYIERLTNPPEPGYIGKDGQRHYGGR